MIARDSAEARYLRNKLVDGIEARGDVCRGPVASVMRSVPRHLFVPDAPLEKAYGDHPIAIGSGQTISQPTVVAMMTEALQLKPTDRVLEIGTGCGYQTAILANLAAEVYTIELIPELAREARERIDSLGLTNVQTRVGDGYRGWLEAAPFDAIVLTAAPPALPEAIVAQLATGGRLVAPVGPNNEDQTLFVIKREHGQLFTEERGAVRFVPMVQKDRPWLN